MEWEDDLEAHRTLEELQVECFGCEVAIDVGASLAEQIPDLVDALQQGHLVIWGYRQCAVTTPAALPNQQPIPKPATRVRTWIEIVLVDQTGKPVPREPYRLILPDGTSRSGSLDEHGLVRAEGIDPGVCDVAFPRIDGREWGRLGSIAAAAAAEDSTGGRPPSVIVRQGEDMTTISARLGFRHWKTVWNDDGNKELREMRRPDLLYPGDRVVYPSRIDKTEDATTAARHEFETLLMSRRLCLDLREVDGSPLAHLTYRLEVDGVLIATDATDATGHLEQEIPLLGRSAELFTSRMTWRLDIAGLDPVDRVSDKGRSGGLQRLRNLGFDLAPIQGDEQAQQEWAVRSFQRDQGLRVDGHLGPETLAALVKAHGS